LITKKPKTAVKPIAPTDSPNVGKAKSPLIPCHKAYKTAKQIAGIDKSIEKRALSVLDNPSIRAQVIVVPERDDPGISEKTCAQPIKKACFKVI